MRQKNPGSNIFVDSRNSLRLKYFGMENLNKTAFELYISKQYEVSTNKNVAIIMLDLVLGVVAIAGIFLIKKFLINEDKKEYNEITNLDEVDIDKPLEEAE